MSISIGAIIVGATKWAIWAASKYGIPTAIGGAAKWAVAMALL